MTLQPENMYCMLKRSVTTSYVSPMTTFHEKLIAALTFVIAILVIVVIVVSVAGVLQVVVGNFCCTEHWSSMEFCTC